MVINAPADGAGGAYVQTLTSLTTTKSSLFDSQKTIFLSQKEKVLAATEEVAPTSATSSINRVHTLLTAVSSDYTVRKQPKTEEEAAQRLFGHLLRQNKTAVDKTENVIQKLQVLLATGEVDPAVANSTELLGEWEGKLKRIVEREAERMKTASLVGRVVGEWVQKSAAWGMSSASEAEKEVGMTPGAKKEVGGTSTVVPEGKAKQVQALLDMIFTPHPLDSNPPETARRVTEYLKDIFESTPESTAFLKKFRNAINKYSREFKKKIPVETVRKTIQALINSDLLSNEKRTILKEQISNNDVLLEELTDVLQMWCTDLGKWKWSGGAMRLEARAQLNGTYRMFLDEELTTAIFLQYVGMYWSAKFKTELASVFEIGAVKEESTTKKVDRELVQGINKFLHSRYGTKSNIGKPVSVRRRVRQQEVFWLSGLPNDMDGWSSGSKDASGSGYPGTTSRVGRLPPRSTATAVSKKDGTDNDSTSRDTGATVKEQLLRTLMTELHLAKALAGDGGAKSFTVVNSDFEKFGPGQSHEILIAIMRFFGMWNEYITFFRTFLSAPCFLGNDPEQNVRSLRRGLPMSHPLSTFFGETVMACLDLVVNKISNGDVYLYRCYDDLWFWNEDVKECEVVWGEMKRFAGVFGLKFNMAKSGSMTVMFDEELERAPPATPTTSLPQGEIKWGFLKLTPKGALIPDESLIRTHITKLTSQLSSPRCSSSILSFVQGWNRYFAGFLPYHFGNPAYCFGKQHGKMVVQQLAYIQSTVLKNLNNGKDTTLVNYLREQITTRYPGVKGEDIPEAWFYWPLQLGGLEILNPIVKLSCHMVWKNPSETWNNDLMTAECEPEQFFSKARDEQRKYWQTKKEELCSPGPWDSYNSSDSDLFPTWEKLKTSQVRVGWSFDWGEQYSLLLQDPEPLEFEELMGSTVEAAREAVEGKGEGEGNGLLGGGTMREYWMRIFAMYGEMVVRRWGGFGMVEKEWVAGGLVRGLKDLKARWDD